MEDGEFIADGKMEKSNGTGGKAGTGTLITSYGVRLYVLTVIWLEFTVSLFIYYPVIETIFFSSLLGVREGTHPWGQAWID